MTVEHGTGDATIRRWTYKVKWWGYSGPDATSLETIEHLGDTPTVLQAFWEDIGITLPEGQLEPSPGDVGDDMFVHRSSEEYRREFNDCAKQLKLTISRQVHSGGSNNSPKG